MPLSDALKPILNALGAQETNKAWAERLKVDPATLSKILSGQIPLSQSRALRWAAELYPGDTSKHEDVAKKLLASANADGLTVAQFCDMVVAEMGGVSVERIGELFSALAMEDNPLICVEYRDMPRTAPDAKYPGIGHELAKAIANGVNFAMFQPFGSNIPLPPALGERVSEEDMRHSPAVRTASFMEEIGEACRGAFLAFQSEAIGLLEARGQGHDDAVAWVKNRLRLYEAPSCGICSSGFSGKIFYIQWDESGIYHKRIFEWVSTPTRDWLLYRGPANINEDALRDSFYPVPHFFGVSNSGNSDERKCLPAKFDGDDFVRLKAATPGFRHPKQGAWQLSSVCND